MVIKDIHYDFHVTPLYDPTTIQPYIEKLYDLISQTITIPLGISKLSVACWIAMT